MREYSKFSALFWTGDTGRKLRAAGRDAQLVAAYLFTCPSANWIGLYYLPLPTLCHEINISEKGAWEALRRVSEAAFAYYDPPSEHIWIPEMAAQQIGRQLEANDNRIKGIVKDLESYRKTPFFNDFLKRYRVVYHLFHVSPSEAPPKALRSQEQEQEIEQKKTLAPPAPREDLFSKFWKAYPKKKSKGHAEKAWNKISPTKELVDRMLASIEKAKRSLDWKKDGGQFIPHPATWLNAKGWEDESFAGEALGSDPGFLTKTGTLIRTIDDAVAEIRRAVGTATPLAGEVCAQVLGYVKSKFGTVEADALVDRFFLTDVFGIKKIIDRAAV